MEPEGKGARGKTKGLDVEGGEFVGRKVAGCRKRIVTVGCCRSNYAHPSLSRA